eukprot:2235359-Rhodomonas_salina.1
MALPTLLTSGEHVVIEIPGTSVLQPDAKALIVPHAQLERHGYKFNLKQGNTLDPTFGGHLCIPDGWKVQLRFENDLYYLPVHAPRSKTKSPFVVRPQALSSNCFELLSDDEGALLMPPPDYQPPPLVSLWTANDVITSHNAWCHPGKSKSVEILDYHHQLFPKDKEKSRRQHCEEAKTKTERRKHQATAKPAPALTALRSASSCILRLHCPKALLLSRLCFAPDTGHVSTLSEDDFLQAFGTNREVQRVEDIDGAVQPERTLHIDHAHAIALGHGNKGYYLIIFVDGVDFLWAAPSVSTSNPEELLDEFLRDTCVKIGKIRMDFASVFARSETFKMWCDARGITMCPTAGYNHTMQARAEGAVRIVKEHV